MTVPNFKKWYVIACVLAALLTFAFAAPISVEESSFSFQNSPSRQKSTDNLPTSADLKEDFLADNTPLPPINTLKGEQEEISITLEAEGYSPSVAEAAWEQAYPDRTQSGAKDEPNSAPNLSEGQANEGELKEDTNDDVTEHINTVTSLDANVDLENSDCNPPGCLKQQSVTSLKDHVSKDPDWFLRDEKANFDNEFMEEAMKIMEEDIGAPAKEDDDQGKLFLTNLDDLPFSHEVDDYYMTPYGDNKLPTRKISSTLVPPTPSPSSIQRDAPSYDEDYLTKYFSKYDSIPDPIADRSDYYEPDSIPFKLDELQNIQAITPYTGDSNKRKARPRHVNAFSVMDSFLDGQDPIPVVADAPHFPQKNPVLKPKPVKSVESENINYDSPKNWQKFQPLTENNAEAEQAVPSKIPGLEVDGNGNDQSSGVTTATTNDYEDPPFLTFNDSHEEPIPINVPNNNWREAREDQY